MFTQNTNLETGIRYGVLSGSEAVDLYARITEVGENMTYEYWRKEFKSAIEAALEQDYDKNSTQEELLQALKKRVENFCDEEYLQNAVESIWQSFVDNDYSPNDAISESLINSLLESSRYEFDEEEFRLIEEDFHYMLNYLGGAPLIWVIKSPYVVMVQSLCFWPCVPNAGDLDSGYDPDGYECYGHEPMPAE